MMPFDSRVKSGFGKNISNWVLDPFAGSGTTCEVARKLNRNSVGIEILAEYATLARSKVKACEYLFLEKQAKYKTDVVMGKKTAPIRVTF